MRFLKLAVRSVGPRLGQMAPRSISLDAFSVSEKRGTLSLTVASLMTLDHADRLALDASPSDLRTLVESGKLWIARTGACRLILSVMLDSLTDLGGPWLVSLIESIRSDVETLSASPCLFSFIIIC